LFYCIILIISTAQARREDVPLLTKKQLNQVESGSFYTGPPPLNSTFILTSWNIGYGKNFQRVMEALTSHLKSNIFLLQEVDKMTNRTRNKSTKQYRNISKLMASVLKSKYLYGIEFQELKQDDKNRPAFTGQTILTRFPILSTQNFHFNYQPADWSRWPLAITQRRNGGRSFLYSKIDIDGNILHLYNTHLESRANDNQRLRQINELINHYKENVHDTDPVIIAGDFNTKKGDDSPLINRLINLGFEDPFYKKNVNTNGKRHKDWVFSRQLIIQRKKIHPHFFGSDHKPISIQYKLKTD